MTNEIYTPLECVVANARRENRHYQTCTKIDYFGYEISIASDQSLTRDSNLIRTEIRIYRGNEDITDRFVDQYNQVKSSDLNIFTSPEDLHFIMDCIRQEQVVEKIDRDAIRRIFMKNGFTIKDGQDDLKEYVYQAAEELLREAVGSKKNKKSKINVFKDYEVERKTSSFRWRM